MEPPTAREIEVARMLHEPLVTAINDNRECITELADGFLGTPRSELAGGGRNNDGAIHRIERVEELLSNGAMKVKISPAVWLPPTIAALAGIVVALIALLGG